MVSLSDVRRASALDRDAFADGIAAEAVASGWAPGVAAAIRVAGGWHAIAAGTLAFDDPRPVTSTTPFRIASLSKPVAGVLGARLIGDGTVDPDAPLDAWLPELARMRVLATPESPLDDTVPADRPITLRQLLTLTLGSGSGFDPTPVQRALQQFATGPLPPPLTPDAFLERLGALPLEHQPGTRWGYHVATEVLSVLIARIAGRPLAEVVQQQIAEPLGMTGTGFWTSRPLPRQYRPTRDAGGRVDGVEPWDEYGDLFTAPPPFPGLAGGLVSTLDDLMLFWGALADGELLPPELHTAMTTPQLDAGQREGMLPFGGGTASWGWQVGIVTGDGDPFAAPGAYGWSGGSGTTASVDPARGIVAIALSQRFVGGPDDDYGWFWRPALAALR